MQHKIFPEEYLCRERFYCLNHHVKEGISRKCTPFNLASPFNNITTNKFTQTTEIPFIRAINKSVNNNYMLQKC